MASGRTRACALNLTDLVIVESARPRAGPQRTRACALHLIVFEKQNALVPFLEGAIFHFMRQMD